MALALKEWSVIVDALGKGKQSVLLRKGGISEEQGEFIIKGNKFLLFPTKFHEAPQHIKESWQPYLNGERYFSNDGKMSINYFAEVAQSQLISDWDMVHKLNNWHAWKEETIKERFERWDKNINLMVLQVFQLNTPIILDADLPQYGGCKSWIDVEAEVNWMGQVVVNKTII